MFPSILSSRLARACSLSGILTLIASVSGAWADVITNYPCSEKFIGGPDFCTSVWSKTMDSTWMEFEIAFKKPAAESLQTESSKALLERYNLMFWNSYRVYKKGDLEKPLTMPIKADWKWEYPGLMVRRYYANTLAMEGIIAKMTYTPGSSSLRPGQARLRTTRYPVWGAAAAPYTLDGRRARIGRRP